MSNDYAALLKSAKGIPVLSTGINVTVTRITEPFPKQWLPGTDYDIAFHRIKSMMLDESLFLWNKDSSK